MNRQITRTVLFATFASTATLMFQNCGQNTTFSMAQGEAAQSIICDGVASSTSCNPTDSKITGEIYSLSADERKLYGADGVSTYFKYGDKVPATILLDQIFIPTRSFTSGFPVSSSDANEFLEDADGNRLFEYFAMRLKTKISLTADQGAGLYQLALLSDDGSVLTRLDTNEVVVDNDKTQSTTLGCGKTISLQQGQSIPIEIDYYQGPREEIALTLMWRKVTTLNGVPPKEQYCGVSGNDTYFGANFDDFKNSGYGSLLSRGWSVVSAANLSHYAANVPLAAN